MTETQNTQNQNANYSTEYLVEMNRFLILHMNSEEIDNKVKCELNRNAFAVEDSLRVQYEEALINRIVELINDKVKKELARNAFADKFSLRKQYVAQYIYLLNQDYIDSKVQRELKRNCYAEEEVLRKQYTASLVSLFE